MLIEFFRETAAPPALEYDILLKADGVLNYVGGRKRQKKVLRVLVQHEGIRVSVSQAVAIMALTMKYEFVTLAFYGFKP